MKIYLSIFLVFDIRGISSGVVTVYHCWIHSIVSIVKAYIPGAYSMFGLFVEVYSYVQPVAGRQSVVIPFLYVIFLLYGILSRTDDGGNFFGNRSCAACREYP